MRQYVHVITFYIRQAGTCDPHTFPLYGRFLTGARNFRPSHGFMELAFAVTACGELLMTQDTPTLRSRLDASVDEFEASKQLAESASAILTEAD